VSIKRLQLQLILHIVHAVTTDITAHAMDTATMTGTAQVHVLAVIRVAVQIVKRI